MQEDAMTVTAAELARALGNSTQMLGHLAGTGAIERPRMVLGPDARWRRAGPATTSIGCSRTRRRGSPAGPPAQPRASRLVPDRQRLGRRRRERRTRAGPSLTTIRSRQRPESEKGACLPAGALPDLDAPESWQGRGCADCPICEEDDRS